MKRLHPTQKQSLENAARRACGYAYAPYSNFPVGAAVLTEEGQIVTGCNVENASLSLTCCAERVALFNAISQGQRQIVALAIYTPTKVPTPPCGACRQALQEFAAECLIIALCDSSRRLESSLAALLPAAFSLNQPQEPTP